MMQTADTPLGELYARIVAAIENGGHLTKAVLGYVETALSSPDPQWLAGFLADADNCERDSLLDLIFFPTLRQQIELEPLLASIHLTDKDETNLENRLRDRPLTSPIRMPDGSLVIRIGVPDYISSQFLRRLNLTWRLDPTVHGAIEAGVPEPLHTRIKVHLRNAGLPNPSPGQTTLCRFFTHMPVEDADYLACLDLLLGLLNTTGRALEGYEMLAGHKRFLFRSLQQAKRFEAMRTQSNMETLMAQGVRAAQAPVGDLMRDMRLVDGICFRLYGKMEVLVSPTEAPERQVADWRDAGTSMDALFRGTR